MIFDTRGGTVGQAAFGVEVDVVDAGGTSVAAGEIGRLRYRGPGVTTASLDEDGKPQPADPDGWFYPGDLAEISADGFVALRGREKDVIIRGGVNIYPAEIEQALIANEAVAEAAVIGVASEAKGEEAVAFVALSGEATVEELAGELGERLAPYKVPSEIRIVDALPRAVSGKIDKKSLAKALADER